MSVRNCKDIYECDGARTTFPITFDFAKSTDVCLWLTLDATGVTRRLIRNLDYTIVNTDVLTCIDDFRSAWPAGYTLTILRRTELFQPSSQAQTPFVFVNRLNQLTEIFQQIGEQLDRTLHVGTNFPPLNLTSKMYAIEAFDSAVGAHGSINKMVYDPLFYDVVGGAGGFVLGGTMREPVVAYSNWPADSATGYMGSINSGSMIAPVVEYTNWPADSATGYMGSINSGSMTL